MALFTYHKDFGHYPPDGFDPGLFRENPSARGGVQLDPLGGYFKNTGCLVYLLGKQHSVNGRITGPYLDFKSLPEHSLSIEKFSFEEFQICTAARRNQLAKVEILDSFGRPLEYDNLESSVLSSDSRIFDNFPGRRSRLELHWPETLENAVIDGDEYTVEYEGWPHSPLEELADLTFDPRRPFKEYSGSVAIDTDAPVQLLNPGHFDIWSHGSHWSDPNDDLFVDPKTGKPRYWYPY